MSVKDSHVLQYEYEHEPVPAKERKSLLSVTLVWAGFPMVITGAVTGGSVVASLGFVRGLLAIILGNLVLCVYVATQSAFAAKTGKSFSLLAKQVFGAGGFRVVSGLLSSIVIGWFAVQTGMTGSGIHQSFGVNTVFMDVLVGLLFILITILGTRALSNSLSALES